MTPKVLISDALSPAAVQIFKDRGVEVDFQPKLGGDKDKLAAEHLELVRTVDKAASRGAMHKNTAARKKARAARLVAGS